MSTNLYWEPLVETGRSLSGELKYIFRKRYELSISKIIIDTSDIEYLRGVRDTGSAEIRVEVSILITAIKKYGKISIWESH